MPAIRNFSIPDLAHLTPLDDEVVAIGELLANDQLWPEVYRYLLPKYNVTLVNDAGLPVACGGLAVTPGLNIAEAWCVINRWNLTFAERRQLFRRFRYILDIAEADGITVHCEVNPDDPQARRLADHLGFKDE